jgi:ABC-2 type transport system permease protein
MHKIFLIARHEFSVNIRRPGFLISTAIFPLIGLLVLLMAAIFGGSFGSLMANQFTEERGNVGVVDHSTVFHPILPEYANRYSLFSDDPIGKQALLAGQITFLLIIPADYMQTGDVEIISKGSGFSGAMAEDSGATRAFLLDHLLRGQVPDAIRIRAADPMHSTLISISSDSSSGLESGGLNMISSFVVPYIVSIFLVISIFTSSGYLLQSVAEEKENRVIEIMLSSVTSTEMMAGKIIGLGALGLTQIAFWIFSSWILSGGAALLLMAAIPLFARPEILILSVMYYFLGYSLFAVLMASAGSLGTTIRESQQIAGIFSFCAAIPYMVSGFLFANPDAILARALSIFPLTAPTMMMMRLPLVREIPWVDIGLSTLALLISIPAALWAGARIFRMGLLMYGKRPSLKQIWSALRQA